MYLAIDFGKKRIGLALGEIMPHPAGVIDGKMEMGKIIEQIELVCRDNDVSGLVIGIPYLKSGSLGSISSSIQNFAKKLANKLMLPIYFEEEQYTSVEARSILMDSDIDFSRKGGEIDAMAAVLILEQFLNRVQSDKDIKPDIEA